MFLGAPAAGKGTQGERLSSELQIPLISTGVILREQIANGTEAGRTAEGYMNRGDLVPDEIVLQMVRERLKKDDCKNGFILDGFPRNLAQAEALHDMGVHLDLVFNIEVPHDILIERASGRRVCAKCQRPYHIRYNPPQNDTVCDDDGAALVQRDDDKLETVKKRLEVYEQLTAPLRDFFEKKGTLRTIDGTGAIDALYESIQKILADRVM